MVDCYVVVSGSRKMKTPFQNNKDCSILGSMLGSATTFMHVEHNSQLMRRGVSTRALAGSLGIPLGHLQCYVKLPTNLHSNHRNP